MFVWEKLLLIWINDGMSRLSLFPCKHQRRSWKRIAVKHFSMQPNRTSAPTHAIELNQEHLKHQFILNTCTSFEEETLSNEVKYDAITSKECSRLRSGGGKCLYTWLKQQHLSVVECINIQVCIFLLHWIKFQ